MRPTYSCQSCRGCATSSIIIPQNINPGANAQGVTTYGQDRDTDYAIRVVAEHARAVSFLIADGVVPGNEGRGYVLRRIIRRAIRYGRRLGLSGPFLTQVSDAAIERFRDAYPELSVNHEFITRVVGLEEDRFAQTFERGIGILDDLIASISDGEGQDGGTAIVSGADVFTLYDTYGFPPELTAEIAREQGLEVDMEGFEKDMEAQRERARAAHTFQGAMEILPTYENLGVGAVDFQGYERLAQESVVTAILVDDAPVGHATQGRQVEVVLRETPFYPEGGGQMGDAGVIAGPNGRVRVEDTQAPIAGLIVHKGIVEEGDISLGETVDALVDPIEKAGYRPQPQRHPPAPCHPPPNSRPPRAAGGVTGSPGQDALRLQPRQPPIQRRAFGHPGPGKPEG